MDNYTNNNIDELTQMRSQLEELKVKLDREVKINETSIRKLQKRNMGFINKYLVFAWIALPVVSLIFVGIKYLFDLSWAVTLVVIVGCAIDTYLDTHFNRMRSADIETMSLVDMGERLSEMKRLRRKQMAIGIPAVFIWFVWFMVELYFSKAASIAANYPGMLEGAMVGAIIGSIVGGIIGYMIYRKMQRDTDSVLEQIKSLKEE